MAIWCHLPDLLITRANLVRRVIIFSKWFLANDGKSGKSSQKCLANVGKSLQNCLANVSEHGESQHFPVFGHLVLARLAKFTKFAKPWKKCCFVTIFLKNVLWQMSSSLASTPQTARQVLATLASPHKTVWQMSVHKIPVVIFLTPFLTLKNLLETWQVTGTLKKITSP